MSPRCVWNKKEAWWPNKLRCITKLSTYYVRSGGKKRLSVECHHISIYFKDENQPSINQHILYPREDLGTMGPLEPPPPPPPPPPPLFCHIKGCEDPKKWPLGPIFYTLPKVVPMSLIMWIQWNFLQNRPESDFWPNFAPLRGQIGPKHIAPGEPKFYTLPTVVLVNLKKQVSFESSGNLLRNRQKTGFLPNFWHYSGPKRARKFGPHGPVFTHTHLAVPTICL